MAETPSTMLPLGTTAPDFRLPDPNGKLVSLADFAGQPALLVMFLCNHCPYVKHVQAELAKLGRDYAPRGVGIVGINSNDATHYPADGPGSQGGRLQLPVSLRRIPNGGPGVSCRLHAGFFLFDQRRQLVYRGQFDASRPGNGIPVTGQDLRAALEALLAGRAVLPEQTPSLGCNIKWRPGREPDYFHH